ncbi:MAG TPA: hypothetical protein VLL52_12085 [Anaerolineae bacterium]|nr:hypothetical protein [Anaerolineae bacterium]
MKSKLGYVGQIVRVANNAIVILGCCFILYQLLPPSPKGEKGEWAVFISDQFHFRFEYPADWIFSEFGLSGSKSNSYERLRMHGNDGAGLYVYQHVTTETDLGKISQWWGKDAHPNPEPTDWPIKLEETAIGQNAYYALRRSYVIRGDTRIHIYYVWHQNNVYAIVLKCVDNEIEQCYETFFNQVLGSIQFLDVGAGVHSRYGGLLIVNK